MKKSSTALLEQIVVALCSKLPMDGEDYELCEAKARYVALQAKAIAEQIEQIKESAS